jgi:hypothetical protein
LSRKNLVPIAIRGICLLAGSLLLAYAPLGAMAADCIVPREHHPWGRFGLGSWKQVRVLTETLDKNGTVVNSTTTETKTTLMDVDNESYTLEIEVTVEVAGKRFNAQPQIVRQGFNGQTEGQVVNFKTVGPGVITIDGQKIPSEVRQITINGGDTKRVSTVHYSDQVDPYVLKRDTTSTDAAGDVTQFQTQVEVIAVNMPYKVLTELKTTSHVKTVHKRDKGSTITLEVQCAAVPGGVVLHSSKELDETGQLVRRSTLELIDYAAFDPAEDPEEGRRRLFNRLRARKPPR